MEHIFFEVQLCSEILIFKEKHVLGILINLCLGTSLSFVLNWVPNGNLAKKSKIRKIH